MMEIVEHYLFLLFVKGNILSVVGVFFEFLWVDIGLLVRHYFSRERGALTEMKHLCLSGNVGNVGNVVMVGNKGNVGNVENGEVMCV